LNAVADDARPTLAADAEKASIALKDEALDQLARVAGAHARRTVNQHDAVADLERETNLDRITLPFLFSGRVGQDSVAELATRLTEQGAME